MRTDAWWDDASSDHVSMPHVRQQFVVLASGPGKARDVLRDVEPRPCARSRLARCSEKMLLADWSSVARTHCLGHRDFGSAFADVGNVRAAEPVESCRDLRQVEIPRGPFTQMEGEN